jgi:hypothetical protein
MGLTVPLLTWFPLGAQHQSMLLRRENAQWAAGLGCPSLEPSRASARVGGPTLLSIMGFKGLTSPWGHLSRLPVFLTGADLHRPGKPAPQPPILPLCISEPPHVPTSLATLRVGRRRGAGN